jgi:hypothetical protein
MAMRDAIRTYKEASGKVVQQIGLLRSGVSLVSQER